ncbi:hypothetical protein [Eubacterium sp.]|uniref:hypothetical protein n=1 Tax=Eubacterium sp. TaxID=142586 RepID=UPI0025F48901|nr:hypothetical protein [Eubacterium sp.]MCR5629302.1 hypothetical protein [Eubacterium sp.]
MSIKKNGHNELIDNINIPEGLSEKVIENCSTKGRTPVFYPKNVAFAAVFLLTLSLGGIGVKAGLDTMHERVSSMDKKEKAQYEFFREDNDNREFDENIGDVAVVYSRDLTRAEAIMQEKLTDEYRNGKFPEESIRFVDNESEIGDNELAVVRDINKVVLPESELTEEQMLQYVDFINKYYTLANEHYAENRDDSEVVEETFSGDFSDEAFRNKIRDKAIAKYNEAFDGNINVEDGWRLQDIEEASGAYFVLMWKDDANAPLGRLTEYITIDSKTGKLLGGSRDYALADTQEFTESEIKKIAEEGKSDMLAFLEKYFDTDEFVKCKCEFANEYEEGCEYVDKTKTSTYDMIEYTVKFKSSKYYVKYNPKTKEVINVDKDIRN